ncbi:uncharacterized protein C8orf76-like [Homarus americanus]|nr:uncharacterized protein C8orf76-like [Homarus americanus]XP_042225302.1 uncharacterized protein C8orf76-like [Homarus americanus]XP_042225303.1 uncharacterized protein C8orf76-like [Homarus americanus]XP_042225304.1 uncharacterized protein C8orf76-like [Homarus americanus]
MEFANLDDDLFAEERQRGTIAEEYSARVCDPCWFMQVHPDELVSPEEELGAQKFVADYLFFKKEYNAAVAKYEEILNILPPNHTSSRRECLEGLSRSHVKKGTLSEALNFAKELHSTSKNCDQTTVSCSVLVDVNLAAGRYSEALTAAQTLVTLQPQSSHLWIKLGYIYACTYGILLPNVAKLLGVHFKVEASPHSSQGFTSRNKTDNDIKTNVNINHSSLTKTGEDPGYESVKFPGKEKGLQFVVACLQRGYVILRKTESTAVDFELDHSQMYQSKLLSDMEFLLDEESLSQIKMHLCQYDETKSNQCLPVQEDKVEFVDRGSSKFKPDESDSEVKLIPQSSFEEQWFKWVI